MNPVTTVLPNYIYKLSPYHIVNTLRFHRQEHSFSPLAPELFFFYFSTLCI